MGITRGWRGAGAGVALLACLAAAQPEGSRGAQPEEAKPGMREVFPHVRVDVAARVVELDGIVPIDCHDPETPDVFLEVVACTPGTKEHEALVMTRAKPSHVHAALLSIGLEPGRPGSWAWDGRTLTRNAPEGPGVSVSIVHENEAGERVADDAREWIVDVETGETFGGGEGDGWVFAGSRMVERAGREVYDADGTGLVVGLTTFGSEVVAWREVISHDSSVTAPEWIANRELVPKFETAVVLRIQAGADEGEGQSGGG